ncbi:HB2D protein, partial [Lanius ludovicianus]|nr:HB2D protein [Lanius ludovicianus]
GAPPDLCPAHTEVFQMMAEDECSFINGTEKVRLVERYFYNRLLFTVFDSDVGHFVGFTPFGEAVSRHWNNDQVFVEQKRAEVDTVCRHNYGVFTPFSVDRRVPPSPSQSLP